MAPLLECIDLCAPYLDGGSAFAVAQSCSALLNHPFFCRESSIWRDYLIEKPLRPALKKTLKTLIDRKKLHPDYFRGLVGALGGSGGKFGHWVLLWPRLKARILGFEFAQPSSMRPKQTLQQMGFTKKRKVTTLFGTKAENPSKTQAAPVSSVRLAALRRVVLQGDVAKVKQMLTRFKPITFPPSEIVEVSQAGVEAGLVEVALEVLVWAGMSLDKLPKKEETFFHAAVKSGSLETLRKVAQMQEGPHRCDAAVLSGLVNARNSKGETAALLAARRGALECLEILRCFGADLSVPDCKGISADAELVSGGEAMRGG